MSNSLPNILFCRKKTANKEAIRQQEPDRQTTAKIQQSQQNLEGGHQWPFLRLAISQLRQRRSMRLRCPEDE